MPLTETPRCHPTPVPQDGRDQKAQPQRQQPGSQLEKVSAGHHFYGRRPRYRHRERAQLHDQRRRAPPADTTPRTFLEWIRKSHRTRDETAATVEREHQPCASSIRGTFERLCVKPPLEHRCVPANQVVDTFALSVEHHLSWTFLFLCIDTIHPPRLYHTRSALVFYSRHPYGAYCASSLSCIGNI